MATSPLTRNRIKEIAQGKAAVDMKLIWLLTVAAGMTVANLYYSQPLLADIARTFAISAGQAGFLGTLTQLGYGLGLLLLVPLGDKLERRTLLVTLLGLESVALLGACFAPTLILMTIACFAIGFFTIVPQIMLPFAAHLATEERRGILLVPYSAVFWWAFCSRAVSVAG